MTTPLRTKSARGTVLVTVMLMVAVAAVIATDIAYRQQMDVLRTGAFLARDAATNYLMGAEELGLLALHKDRKEDDRKFRENASEEIGDHWGEDWYRGAMFPLPDGIGLIEGKLHDLQGRFNINSLADPDAKRQALFAGVFVSMMNDLLASNPDAFPEGTTANMLKERVIDWLDTDQENTGFDGREDDDYFRKERPYRTANHVITDASELLLIDGFTPQALALLEDKISFLPYSAKINLFTADKDLLIKLGFSAAEATEFADKQRPQKHKDPETVRYATTNELFTFLMGSAGQASGAQSATGITPANPTTPTSGTTGTPGTTSLQVDMFDIKSEYYLLKGKAVVNGKPVLVESVIWKPPLQASNPGAPAGTNPEPPVTTILRKFVDPLKQTN